MDAGEFGRWWTEWSFEALLRKQPFLTVLPAHGAQIARSFVVFTAISWLTHFFIAPKLILYSERKNEAGEKHALEKWGHMIASIIHAVAVTVWSSYLWYTVPLPDSVEERVFGYSRVFGDLLGFTVGYFFWDCCCCIWNMHLYGKEFFIHSLLGIVGLNLCFKPFMMHQSSRFLIFECSTIFIDIHWILKKLGYAASSREMILTDVLALIAFVGARLVLGTYFTYSFSSDILAMRSSIPVFYISMSLLANFTTHALNFYWFIKLANSFVRSKIKKANEGKKKKQ